jgi:hypothetical protein
MSEHESCSKIIATYLGETDERVRADLRPDVDGRSQSLSNNTELAIHSVDCSGRNAAYVTSSVSTSVGRVSTRAHSVDVELCDGGPDDGKRQRTT